jgi:CheY-like chemotaxis protein
VNEGTASCAGRDAAAAQVLLADDDPMVLRTLANILRQQGLEVWTAQSGKEAIALLAEHNYDLVLTDMHMETPAAGFDVLRAAKQQPGKPLVVILSAYPIPSLEWKKAGADAMFLKGSGIVRMLTDIGQMVSRRLLDREKDSGQRSPTKEDKRAS